MTMRPPPSQIATVASAPVVAGTGDRFDAASLAVALARAHQYALVEDWPAVAHVLNVALTRVDGSPPHPDEVELIDAAVLFAQALAASPKGIGLAVEWAAYAHRTSQDLYGLTDPRTVEPARTYARLLTATDAYTVAAAVRRDLVAALTATDGSGGLRTLCARADLATALHHTGACQTAYATLADAWTAQRVAFGEHDLIAVRMCVRLATMYLDCGDPDPARWLFTQARRLAAENAHTVAMLARVAGRPADPVHHAVCTHTPDHDRFYWPGQR